MEPTRPTNCVSLILNSKIHIENVTQDKNEMLQNLGGYEENGTWIINFRDETHLASILSYLAENDMLFVGGPSGWPPAEIFADLRDKNVLVGGFKEIIWMGKDKWFIKDR